MGGPDGHAVQRHRAARRPRRQRAGSRASTRYFMRQGPARNDSYEGVRQLPLAGHPGRSRTARSASDWSAWTRTTSRRASASTWAPAEKWVIRTGGGYFYSQDTGNPRFDMARNLAGRLRFNSNTQTPNLNWDNSLASRSPAASPMSPRPYTFANPYDRRTPYTMQYLFNLQRELPGDTVFEVGYLGSVSRHLESLRAVNEAIPACPSRTARPARERPLRVSRSRSARRSRTSGASSSWTTAASAATTPSATKLTKRYSPGSHDDGELHLGEVDRHGDRDPQPGWRHAVPAEQLLPLLRERAGRATTCGIAS